MHKTQGTIGNFTTLLDENPDGLHLSCHGEKDSLTFELDDCTLKPLGKTDLSKIL